jgi:CelD/BcsL family acetyltransferase involved in cellulose biosynthesis
MNANARWVANPYTCSVVSDLAGMDALQPEWDALHEDSHDSYLGESFAWTRLCWSHRYRKRELYCLTVRLYGRLVAVWPLEIVREVLWRVASPIRSSSEYCPFLIHPRVDAEAVWEAVRRTLAHSGVDALRLLNVRADSVLGRRLSRSPGWELYRSPSMSIGREEMADWPAFRARLPPKLRQSLGRYRRRFSESADLAFEDLTDPAEREAAWKWMLAVKRRWAERRGVRNKWLFSDEYDRFMTASLAELGAARRKIFVLKADGAIVAGELASVDGARVEAFISCFDEAFAQFSPGVLLHEDCIRWAGEHGLDYEMRIGGGHLKESWATRTTYVTSYAIPFTPQGRLFTACLQLGKARSADRRDLQPDVRPRPKVEGEAKLGGAVTPDLIPGAPN